MLDYQASTLLTGEQLIDRKLPIPLNEVLQRWFARREDFDEVLGLLLAPFYAAAMTPEHRYSSVFQSAEALHDKFAAVNDLAAFTTKELSKKEHQERVVKVVDQLRQLLGEDADDHLEWAGRVLRGRNDRSLPQKVAALLSSAGEVGSAVLSADADFAGSAAGLRARVSHGGGGSQPQRRHLRAVCEEALRWLVRGHLVCHLLLPASEHADFWQRLSRRHAFIRLMRALEQAGETSQ